MARTFRACVLLFLGMPLTLGCNGPDHEKYCERWSTCHAGNDNDVEACVVRLDARLETANLQGCTAEYDEYFDCLLGNTECREGQIVETNADKCKSENAAFEKCFDGSVDVNP